MHLCPAVVKCTSFSPSCSTVWFSPAAWRRNCFVSRKGMFEHQPRLQPVTADLESTIRNTERRCLASAVGGRISGQSVSSQELSSMIAKKYPSKSGARVTDATGGVSTGFATLTLSYSCPQTVVLRPLALRMSSAHCWQSLFTCPGVLTLVTAVLCSVLPTFPLAFVILALRVLGLTPFPFLPLSTSMGADPVAAGMHDIHHFVTHHRKRCESLALQHQVVSQASRTHLSYSSKRNRSHSTCSSAALLPSCASEFTPTGTCPTSRKRGSQRFCP